MFLVVLLILAVMTMLGPSIRFSSSVQVPPVSRSTRKKKKRKPRNIFLGIFILFAFILLIIADFTPAWITLALALLALVVLILRKRTLKKEVHRLILPIALIVISVLFLVLNFRGIVVTFPKFVLNQAPGLLPERVMTQGESWSVAGKTMASGLKSALIGSGPGTFFYNFSKFRPSSLNQGDLWAVTFDRSGNVFAELLATMGFLGLAGFLSILGILFWLIFGPVWKRRKLKLDNRTQFLLLLLAALILIQFFYYPTLVLSFLLWLFLALTIGWYGLRTREEGKPSFVKVKEFKLKDFVEMALVLETICIVLFLAFVVVCFFGFKVYLADAKYVKALNEPDLDEKAQILQEAIRLNTRQARYQMVISKVFLVKAQSALAGLEPNEDQGEVIQNLQLARLFATSASNVAPNQLTTWQNLADLYEVMATMSREKEQFVNLAIDALRRVSDLEPSNPRIYSDIGRLYLILDQKEAAKGEFQKAEAQKADFGPANIGLALMLEDEGNNEEAMAKLEWFLSRVPNNSEALFQLGRLYYNDGRTERAITQFIAALSLNPRYSNARYSLGIAYEKQGKIDDALEQLDIVSAANPGNEEVKERIRRLRAGTSVPEEEIEELEEEEEGVLEEIE